MNISIIMEVWQLEDAFISLTNLNCSQCKKKKNTKQNKKKSSRIYWTG